jgi:hypothetical protein
MSEQGVAQVGEHAPQPVTRLAGFGVGAAGADDGVGERLEQLVFGAEVPVDRGVVDAQVRAQGAQGQPVETGLFDDLEGGADQALPRQRAARGSAGRRSRGLRRAWVRGHAPSISPMVSPVLTTSI